MASTCASLNKHMCFFDEHMGIDLSFDHSFRISDKNLFQIRHSNLKQYRMYLYGFLYDSYFKPRIYLLTFVIVLL